MDKKEAIEVLQYIRASSVFNAGAAIDIAIAAIEESMVQKPDNQQPQGEIARLIKRAVYNIKTGSLHLAEVDLRKAVEQLSPSAANVGGH